MTDWLPTFAKIGGVSLDGGVDGKNVWRALSEDRDSPRWNVLAHYDQDTPYASLIDGHFKYISGTTLNGIYDTWLSSNDTDEFDESFKKNYPLEILSSNAGKSLRRFLLPANKVTALENEILKLREDATITCKGKDPYRADQPATEKCNPLNAPCLFDLWHDPCETTNLAGAKPHLLAHLKAKADHYAQTALPTRNRPSDPRANPAQFNGTWTWWYDELGIEDNEQHAGSYGPRSQPSAPVAIVLFLVSIFSWTLRSSIP